MEEAQATACCFAENECRWCFFAPFQELFETFFGVWKLFRCFIVCPIGIEGLLCDIDSDIGFDGFVLDIGFVLCSHGC